MTAVSTNDSFTFHFFLVFSLVFRPEYSNSAQSRSVDYIISAGRVRNILPRRSEYSTPRNPAVLTSRCAVHLTHACQVSAQEFNAADVRGVEWYAHNSLNTRVASLEPKTGRRGAPQGRHLKTQHISGFHIFL